MKPRYTILSFNFGDYDILREPKVVDPNAEYVYVTDRPTKSSRWKVIVDPKLTNRHPVYSAYFVRYNPFEYASTENVILLDSSVQINDSLATIAEECFAHDYTVMLTNYRTDEDKLKQWTSIRGMKQDEADRVLKFIDKTGARGQKGSIGRAFIAMKDTPDVRRFNKHVWRYLIALGQYGIPNRMDEVVAHKLLDSYKDKLDIFAVSIQLVQSTYMTYCSHKSPNPITHYDNYDQMYYICNMPVSPLRFSKEFNYPTSYRYRTEAMLLTRHLNPEDLNEWLEWHISKCGFDRIHIFDNESDYDVRKVIEPFGERVTYELIEGQPRQYKLYDEYVNWKSQAEWIMPIDDDEFLDIGDFGNVGDAIRYYEEKFPHLGMLAVRWKHLFPEDFSVERTGKVMAYGVREDPELARKFMRLGDDTVKTLVRRNGPVHYEETWENPAGGHVPKHKCFYGALTCDGKTVVGCGLRKGSTVSDERIRLIHCRFRGPDEWMRLNGGRFTVSDAVPRRRTMPTLEELAEWRSMDA